VAIFKETKKSLRWFLIIVGLLGLYSSIPGFGSFREQPTLIIIASIISTILNLITLYIGIKFYTLIQTSSGLLIKFFWFNIIWTIVGAILYIYSSGLVNAGIFIFLGIEVLIYFVIINSIKRLDRENSD
jgi:hypothetical protein